MQAWQRHGTHAALPASTPRADMTNGFQCIFPLSWAMASGAFFTSGTSAKADFTAAGCLGWKDRLGDPTPTPPHPHRKRP